MDPFTRKYAQQGGFLGFFKKSLDKGKTLFKNGIGHASKFTRNTLERSTLDREGKKQFDKNMYKENVQSFNKFLEKLEPQKGSGPSANQVEEMQTNLSTIHSQSELDEFINKWKKVVPDIKMDLLHELSIIGKNTLETRISAIENVVGKYADKQYKSNTAKMYRSITKNADSLINKLSDGLDSKQLAKMQQQSNLVSSYPELEAFLMYWSTYAPNLRKYMGTYLAQSNSDNSIGSLLFAMQYAIDKYSEIKSPVKQFFQQGKGKIQKHDNQDREAAESLLLLKGKDKKFKCPVCENILSYKKTLKEQKNIDLWNRIHKAEALRQKGGKKNKSKHASKSKSKRTPKRTPKSKSKRTPKKKC